MNILLLIGRICVCLVVMPSKLWWGEFPTSILTLPLIPFLIAFSTCTSETKIERVGKRKRECLGVGKMGIKKRRDRERANETESELNLKENEREGVRS